MTVVSKPSCDVAGLLIKNQSIKNVALNHVHTRAVNTIISTYCNYFFLMISHLFIKQIRSEYY